MDLYRYKAVTMQGRQTRGRLDAINAADLELRLQRMGLELINCTQIRTRGSQSGRGVKRRDLITFCSHMEQLTRAGVPILEGLGDLRDSVDSPRMRNVVSAMIESIQGGKNLSQAMADFPGVFGNVFVNLIRAGEESGQLPEVLRQVTESLKWQDEQAAYTQRLLMYPALVGTVVFVVMFFLMTYLVPELLKFIKSMQQTVPWHTQLLISISGFFRSYWYAILLAPVLIIGSALIAIRTQPAVRLTFDGLLLRIPHVGEIQKKLILARFATYFALLYRSGITVLECIRICAEIAGNKAVEEAIRAAGRQIADGAAISASFASTGLFPPLVLRMLRVGENTGALDQSLANIGYFYSRDVRESIERLQALLGPAMTFLLGGLLLWVMMSVLGPIYDLIAKIKV